MGPLANSPAEILASLLVQLHLGSAAPAVPWPVFYSGEPSGPDAVITLYDTQGRDFGYTQPDGERQEYHGFQVRVRAADHGTGYAKARAIAVALDTAEYNASVTIGSQSYCIGDVVRTSDVIALGKESPTSTRRLFVVNGLAHLRAAD